MRIVLKILNIEVNFEAMGGTDTDTFLPQKLEKLNCFVNQNFHNFARRECTIVISRRLVRASAPVFQDCLSQQKDLFQRYSG